METTEHADAPEFDGAEAAPITVHDHAPKFDAATPSRRSSGFKFTRGKLITAGVVAVAVVVGLVIAIGGMSSGGATSQMSVNGDMLIKASAGNPFNGDYAYHVDQSSGTCTGVGGYSDINQGAQVVISDDSGKTLAITSLDKGAFFSGQGCVFMWHAKVPKLGFYGVSASNRGTVKFSQAEMAYLPELTLG
jgi:hypothetical protein